MSPTEPRTRVERGLYVAGSTYYACATPPGARNARWKSLGPVGIQEARRLRDAFVSQIRAGSVPTPEAARVTFESVAADWLDRQAHLRDIEELAPRTYESYESALRLHVNPRFGARRITSITSDDLAAWHREQLGAGAARWSVRARWTPLVSVLKYAVRLGVIPSNPADQLETRERPKMGESRVRFLSKVELQALLEHAPKHTQRGGHEDLGYLVGIAVGVFGGLRISEALGLTWQDIDFERGEIHVRYQASRQGKRVKLKKSSAARRSVILMPTLARVLRRHRMASPWSQPKDFVLATVTGETLGARNLSQRGLDKATDAAGLEDVTFHILRHTFASILIDQGRDVAFVAAQLGHSNSRETLKTYTHLFDAARHSAEARDQLEAGYGHMLGSDA